LAILLQLKPPQRKAQDEVAQNSRNLLQDSVHNWATKAQSLNKGKQFRELQLEFRSTRSWSTSLPRSALLI